MRLIKLRETPTNLLRTFITRKKIEHTYLVNLRGVFFLQIYSLFYLTDQQLKEQQAILILERHEKEEREHQITHLKTEFDKLQNKHQILIVENNTLSVKVHF